MSNPRVHPSDPGQLAAALCQAGRFSEALAVATQVLDADDANVPPGARLHALHLAATSSLGLQQMADAEAYWRRALELDPTLAAAYGGLGLLTKMQKRTAETEALYRAWATHWPDNAEAHNNHGVALQELGRLADAEAAYRRALEIRADYLEARYNLGLVLQAAQRPQEAEQAYQALIASHLAHSQSQRELGDALKEQGKLAEAEATYRRSRVSHASYPLAFNNLAALLKARGSLPEAELAIRCAIALRPDLSDAHNTLGVILDKLERWSDAEAAFGEALSLNPNFAECHYNLGIVQHAQKRLPEAEASYRRSLELKPNAVETLSNLGAVLHESGRAREAAVAYQQALALRPDLAGTHYSLGIVHKGLGQLDEAEAALRQALVLQPGYGDAKFALSTLLLSMERFDDAWPLYESRYDLPRFVHHHTLSIVQCPRWQGESLEGRSLLVWQEDGLGDMIQFGRYFAALKARGVARIAVACMPALHRLVASIDGVDEVFDNTAGKTRSAEFDCWTSLLSVPLHVGTHGNVPVAYLKPDPARVEHWRAQLDALPAGPRIGLVWKGNPRHHNDAHRSIPSLAQLAPLWNVPGARFVSLQKGQGEDDAQQPPADQPLLHLGTALTDLADSAAIVAQLDLVICVDTAIAHVAGSVGTPCWVMLPAHDLDWRWGHAGNDTRWYPGMRLFRQPPGAQWLDLIEQVAHACATAFA
ncbi:Tfp pilus assembly protein PilF [Paraburkholderia caballeronis]|uniref:tetratricopeptide repeat protein n=1 Tax=Paraburkholderia caballeronis TaxID=416943 RepID=UPI001064D9D8|nr:tetratricopeptide repeat protein [Paraburkholderia caballeronis]TDV25898.1 Tfp pilus assembly protein PilF [Paraburkholderia caballeronis]